MIKKFLALAVAGGIVIWGLLPSSVNRHPESGQAAASRPTDREISTNVGESTAHILTVSPFGKGPPPPLDKVALVNQRRQRMVAGGFTTPEKYFHMDIKELTELAKKQDPFASLQLGERYWSEPIALNYDMETDRSDSNRNIAVKYFTAAIAAGAVNVTPIMAKRFFEVGDVQEAAAWNIVARHRGIRDNEFYFNSKNAFSQLSNEEIFAANKRAKEIAVETGFPIL